MSSACPAARCCHTSEAWLRAHFDRRAVCVLLSLLLAAIVGAAHKLSGGGMRASAVRGLAGALCLLPIALGVRVGEIGNANHLAFLTYGLSPSGAGREAWA